jgi:hypothetical protein
MSTKFGLQLVHHQEFGKPYFFSQIHVTRNFIKKKNMLPHFGNETSDAHPHFDMH